MKLMAPLYPRWNSWQRMWDKERDALFAKSIGNSRGMSHSYIYPLSHKHAHTSKYTHSQTHPIMGSAACERTAYSPPYHLSSHSTEWCDRTCLTNALETAAEVLMCKPDPQLSHSRLGACAFTHTHTHSHMSTQATHPHSCDKAWALVVI